MVCRAGLGDGEGALWMKNLAIGAAQGTSGPDDAIDRIAAIGTLGAAAIWCGARARGRDARVAGLTLGINDAINWAGQHAAGRIYVSAHRRFAVLADEAGAVSMERERQSAAEAERSRQHRLLHATTVDVLRDLAQSTDAEAAGIIAQREAARLRHALRSRGGQRSQLETALQSACDASATRGLTVELVTSELTADVSDAVADALQRRRGHVRCQSRVRSPALAARSCGPRTTPPSSRSPSVTRTAASNPVRRPTTNSASARSHTPCATEAARRTSGRRPTAACA